jgi:hypothetical protein
MGKRFQGGQGFFRSEVEQFGMCLDHFKVKGHDTIEQGLIGRKAVGMR